MNYADAVELWWDTLRIYVAHATSQLVLVPESDVTENLNEEDLIFDDILEDRSMTDMGVDVEEIVRDADGAYVEDVCVNIEEIVRDAEGVHVEDVSVNIEDIVRDVEGVNSEVQNEESGDDARKASMEWFEQGTNNDISVDERKIVGGSDDDVMESTNEDNVSDGNKPRKRKATNFREEKLEDDSFQNEAGQSSEAPEATGNNTTMTAEPCEARTSESTQVPTSQPRRSPQKKSGTEGQGSQPSNLFQAMRLPAKKSTTKRKNISETRIQGGSQRYN
ncbi:hypothetical protein CJ030_MR6G025449 [Morella rubra]|uniref:Uncharacterized protein n=1 Tax=Morella rubra TaxID=262757 RepID=A0A6A1VC06_9ROSI|nr:hypothetical protein CJ030_MR6G025449 [Morella rubra]